MEQLLLPFPELPAPKIRDWNVDKMLEELKKILTMPQIMVDDVEIDPDKNVCKATLRIPVEFVELQFVLKELAGEDGI